jgi:hypothetical protein
MESTPKSLLDTPLRVPICNQLYFNASYPTPPLHRLFAGFTANIVCTLLVMVFFPQESSSSELSYSVNRQQLLPSKSFMTNASFE